MSSKNLSINILILAVGKLELKEVPGNLPVCLAEIFGMSVLERILEKTAKIKNANFTFVFLEDDSQKFHLSKIADILKPQSSSIVVPDKTKGSLCTSLLAACNLKQSSELLIVSANELVNIDLDAVVKDFRYKALDAGTIIFKSIQPMYSYVRLDDENIVHEAAQRRPISQDATAGIFWFSKTSDFINGAKSMIKKDCVVDGSFYIAPVFNELILRGHTVGVYRLGSENYIPLKTNEQLQRHISNTSTDLC